MRATLIIICFLGLNLFAQNLFAQEKCGKENSSTCIDKAQALLKVNDWQNGLKILKELCDAGVAKGCLKAGIVEEKLNRKDEAKELYLKACELNNEKECKNAKAMEKR